MYVAVVGASLNNLAEDSISLALGVGLIGLELGAVLDVVAGFFVPEAHVVSWLSKLG